MSRAPSNPFYAGEPAPQGSSGSSGPPPYRASNRPVPATPAEPVSYTSLSDLTKGKQQKAGSNSFSYQPSSQRAGYREGGPVQNQPISQGARRLPPDPQANRDRSLLPPQRNVAGKYAVSEAQLEDSLTGTTPPPPPAPPAVNQSYWQKAQGYVPNSVSATAMSAGDKLKSGADSVLTQQNRDAVSPSTT
jgi:hypothetical protein